MAAGGGHRGTRVAITRAELRRRMKQTGGRGRKVRGLLELLRPYRTNVILMFVALALATGASLAPPPLAAKAASCPATSRR